MKKLFKFMVFLAIVGGVCYFIWKQSQPPAEIV